MTKAITFNAAPGTGKCQWGKVAGNIKCPALPNRTAFLKTAIVGLLKALMRVPRLTGDVEQLNDVSDGNNPLDAIVPWKKEHAEILIGRWALRHFSAPPTHRVLDLATSREACDDDDGDRMGCNKILPTFIGLHPLLFETTIYVP
jgi:hypothetical protein